MTPLDFLHAYVGAVLGVLALGFSWLRWRAWRARRALIARRRQPWWRVPY